MEKKRILIVDDHSAVRTGLKNILNSRYNYLEFGEAENADQCHRRLPLEKWDMIILDINLPDKNGLILLKEIRENKITIPVLVFSFHQEEPIAIRAIRLGAHGYLSKDAPDIELIRAVDLLLNGKKYISSAISSQIAGNLQGASDREPHELLSDREFQTFLLIVSGKSISEMAEELSLSVSTLNTYRARVLEKMKMKSTVELIRYAIEKKLL